jgi:eukaryotic-like serine/threonine-protein kinase
MVYDSRVAVGEGRVTVRKKRATVRRTFRRWLPYAIVIIGGFLLAYLIVAFFVFPSGVIPGNAKVPNVAGLTYDDAAKRLAEVGFRAERGEQRYHGGAPKGTVLEQSPHAGQRDVEGATITLVVSAGQRMAFVPSIVGLPRSAAEEALQEAGFELGQVFERPSSAPPGEVIESKPAPGSRAAIPGSVSLVISVGSTTTGSGRP